MGRSASSSSRSLGTAGKRLAALLAAAVLLAAADAKAANCISAGSGTWTAITWTNCPADPAAGDNVTIQAGHTVALNTSIATASALASLNVAGTLTFGNSNTARTLSVSGPLAVTGTINISANNNTHTFNVGGNISNSGVLDFWDATNRVINLTLNGTALQTISGAGTFTFNNLTAANSATFDSTVTATALATVTVAAGRTVTNNGTIIAANVAGVNATTSIWTQGANSSLEVSGTLLTLGVLNASASGNTVRYNANAAQAVKLPSGGDYFHLSLAGGNTKTPAAGTYDILGDLTVEAATTFDVNASDPTINVTGNTSIAGTYTSSATAALTMAGDLSISGTYTGNGGAASLAGNFTRTGTFTSGTGVFTFNSSSATAQTITGATTFTNLTINNNGAGVTLNSDVTATLAASGTLTLQNGKVNTGANNLITSGSCAAPSVVRTNGWVNGNLRKNIPAGASNCTFEIGDASSYTPVAMAFAAGTTAGNLTARTTAGDHPNLSTSSLDPNFTVNRYWTLTNAGVGFTTFSATFTFVAGDLDTDTNTANVQIQRFAGGTWNATTIGTRTGTTTQATGLNAVGDFQIGEGRPASGASSFNAVEVGTDAITGVIKTKVAGVSFQLDLVGLNAARNAINTSFKGPVTVELLNASNNTGALDGNGCRNTWALIQSFSVVFTGADSGRHTTSFTEANSWPEARVRVKYTIAGTDLLIGCSTDNFAIRPATFASFSASDTDWATAGTTRTLANTATTGGNVHKAGRPFTMSATAVNGAGTPATMTSYSGSPVVVVASTVEPASGALGTVTPGTWSASAGVITTTTATYSEAGVISVRLEDQGFANVDATDGSTTAERYIVSSPLDVGRFVPDHFAFTSPSTPQLRTFGATCAGARAFTYVGQPFWYVTLPSATIEARNAAGNVTTNYRGTLFKLTASGITETYSGNGIGPTLNVGSAVSPPQFSTGNGSGTYTAAASAANVNLSFARDATTPVAPFTANISLTVSASDGSESGPPEHGTITSTSSLTFNGSGSGIAFDSGAAFRYGYVGLTDVFGPLGGNSSGNAPVAIEARYWSGTAFDLNGADNCSTFSNANFLLYAHAGDVNTTNLPPATKVSLEGGSPLALTAGRAVVNVLSPTPALAKPGSAKLCLDLDAASSQTDGDCIASSPSNKAYLQGRWRGTSYNKDPEARVGFGLFGSQPRNFIFFRENY